MTKKKRFLVLDGTALAFRSFFAMPPLTDSSGRPSGALAGYCNALLRAIDDMPSDSIVVCWDRSEPTFRHELIDNYKANREELDDDLRVQFPWMREATDLLGIRSLDQAGMEADDIMATLAAQGDDAGFEVYLYSSDKDLSQCVTESVWQCPPPRPNDTPKILKPDDIIEKYGLGPASMADWQALVGDSTDNIKGVAGVGAKTATKLLQKYGDLDSVLARGPQEEKGKLAERLGEHADDARMALQLVTLRTDLDFDAADNFPRATPDWLELDEFCIEHSFTTLRTRLQKMRNGGSGKVKTSVDSPKPKTTASAAPPTKPATPTDYQLVDTPAKLKALRDRLTASDGFAFDTETTGLDALQAELVGMSFSDAAHTAFYVPVLSPEHPSAALTQANTGSDMGDLFSEPAPAIQTGPAVTGPDGEHPVEYLRGILEDAGIPKFGQNCKYDLHIMQGAGLTIAGWACDTMIAHFLLAPDRRHGLDDISLSYLDIRKIPTSDLLGKGAKAITMDQVDLATVSEYACEDADTVFQLVPIFREAMHDAAVTDVFEQIEMPLMPVLARMESAGISLHEGRLSELSVIMHGRRDALQARVHEIADESFNLNSPKQLGPILFEKLLIQDEAGINKVGRTKTGFKTDAATLEKYVGLEIVDKLLEFRRLSKLLGTYVDTLPQDVHADTQRIHTSFNQAVAATGRLSSSAPNLQNIPNRHPEGREIRQAFIPGDADSVLLSADYSQVELRVVAHLSGDEALQEAFRNGADVHAATAARVFEVEPADVTHEMRSHAKTINFGLLYGMGAHRLGRETNMSHKEAKDFIERYYDAMPGVRDWLESTLIQAQESGEARTLAGRRRPLPELQSRDGRVRSNAENAAVNTPVQGTAADLIKEAMLKIDARLTQDGLQSKMILQVHDELVFDCPRSELETLSALVVQEMESVGDLSIPLKVDLGSGATWADAH